LCYFINSTAYAALNGGVTVNNVLERIWKEAMVIAYFKALTQHICLERIRNNH
jgi:hypothetical protein